MRYWVIQALLLADDLHAAHPGTQHLGDDHGAVVLLELLDDGGDQAGGGKAGAVEGVEVLDLLGVGAAEADTIDEILLPE